MTTAVIVQARLGSTRLPAKVLLPLPTGRTVLEEVLHRCTQIPGVDVVVCAIPDTPENDILFAVIDGHMKRNGGWIVRGPEHDVLARYAKAAEAVNADTIVRITSDCPLIDPTVCDSIVLAYKANPTVPYVSNCHPRSWPQGLDCEVFSRGQLIQANAMARTSVEREHVTPFIIANTEDRRLNVRHETDRSHLRWTLDTLEDYVRIWGVFEEQMKGAA